MASDRRRKMRLRRYVAPEELLPHETLPEDPPDSFTTSDELCREVRELLRCRDTSRQSDLCIWVNVAA